MRTNVSWIDTGTRRYACGEFVVHLAADTPHDGVPSGLWINGIVDTAQVSGSIHLPTTGFRSLANVLRRPPSSQERLMADTGGLLFVRNGDVHALRGLGGWQGPGAGEQAIHAPARLWQRMELDVARLRDGHAWDALGIAPPTLPVPTEVASLSQRLSTPRR